MEMLPELVDPFWENSRPSGGATSFFRLIMSRCDWTEVHLHTENKMKMKCIVCSVSDIWRQILYNWSLSHINYFIAGPIEEIIGSGAASAVAVQTTTEAAVAASGLVTVKVVKHVRKEPVVMGVAKSGLTLKPLGYVRGQSGSLVTKDVEIGGDFIVFEIKGGSAAWTLEVIRGRVSNEDRRSTASSDRQRGQTQLEVSYRGASNLQSKGQGRVKCRQPDMINTSSSGGWQSPLIFMKMKDTAWPMPLNTPKSPHKGPPTGLQTKFLQIQLESHNLLPAGCHQVAEVVILNSTSEIQPAEPGKGKGTQHAAMSDTQLGTATSIGVVRTSQKFVTIMISSKYDNEPATEVVIAKSQ